MAEPFDLERKFGPVAIKSVASAPVQAAWQVEELI